VAATDLFAALAAAWHAASRLELAGAAAGFVYIVLAIREHRGCWIAGSVSTALYLAVFVDARLYLQGALQGAYLVLAVYGWREWRRDGTGATPLVRRASPRLQAALLLAAAAAAALTVPALRAFTDAASPGLDAATTWASIAATWLLARRYADNWLWWVVIDLAIAVLAVAEALWLTALLYLACTGLAAVGFLRWRRDVAVPP
jgi:nicotinamide mononucleotide transporter